MTEEPVAEPVEEPAEDPVEEPAGDEVVGDLEASDADHERVRTGLGGVDSVVDDVAGLSGQPVEEHVAVYESAHERLRRTLDDPHAGPDAGPDASPDASPEPERAPGADRTP